MNTDPEHNLPLAEEGHEVPAQVWVVIETYSWYAFSQEYNSCRVFRTLEAAQAFAETLRSECRNAFVEGHIYMDWR